MVHTVDPLTKQPGVRAGERSWLWALDGDTVPRKSSTSRSSACVLQVAPAEYAFVHDGPITVVAQFDA